MGGKSRCSTAGVFLLRFSPYGGPFHSIRGGGHFCPAGESFWACPSPTKISVGAHHGPDASHGYESDLVMIRI